MGTPNAIETSNLRKTYGEKSAVKDLNLTVEKGEVYGFLGPNGAGKTTTMRMLTCLLNPTSGTASVDGVSIENPDELVKHIGYVPSEPPLYDKLTGREHLEYTARLRGLDVMEKKDRMDALLERFELSESADDAVESYSRGMRKKISVIQSVIHSPEVLFLDEPTSGLDPQSAREMRKLLEESTKTGQTVFLSTHILPVVDEVADTVGLLKNGTLVAQGPPDELKTEAASEQQVSLEDAFIDITA